MASLRKALPAGQVDSGLASLATFITGLYAASTFDPATLGGYALLFSAFVLAAELPAQLVFTPGEIIAVEQSKPLERLEHLHSTTRTALRIALATGAVVGASSLLVSDAVPDAAVWALASTATANSVLSPMQDHLRRMLHVANVSWWAAQTSLVNMVVVVTSLFALDSLGLPSFAPFGALVVGNLVSLAYGWLRARPARPRDPVRFIELSVIGRWLMVVGVASAGGGLATATVVQGLAGAEALGYAEGARVVGRPLQVIAVGLLAVFGPRLMEAAIARAGAAARRLRWQFALLGIGMGIPYAVLIAEPWTWNPFAERVSNAYAISGLVLVTTIANIVQNLSYPHRSELGGSRQQVKLAVVEVVANIIQLGVAFSAVFIGPFAIPVSALVGAVLRLLVYSLILARYYSRGEESVRAPA